MLTVIAGIFYENGYIFILGMIFGLLTFNITLFVDKNENKLSRLIISSVFGLVAGMFPK